MKIIRPYGESRTERNCDQFQRVLYDRTSDRNRHTVRSYAKSHDELVISQWVSLMDKIARKPSTGQGAVRAQRSFREKLARQSGVSFARTIGSLTRDKAMNGLRRSGVSRPIPMI